MDKAQALHQFWSSFSIDAIDELSAYDPEVMKSLGDPDEYITYEVQTSNLGEPVSLTASLWYKNKTSWAEISRKADEIAEYIGYGGRIIAVDGGYIWVRLGSPFAQRMAVEQNDSVRRIYLNIWVDFFTAT